MENRLSRELCRIRHWAKLTKLGFLAKDGLFPSFVSCGTWRFPAWSDDMAERPGTNHAAGRATGVLHWMPIASERIHGYSIAFQSGEVLVG